MNNITSLFTASIQRKILSSFAVVVLLVLVMVSVGYYQLNQVRQSARQIPEDSAQLAASQELVLALTSLEANLERFFVIGGAQFQEAVHNDLETMVSVFEAQAEIGADQAVQQIGEELNSLTGETNSLVRAGNSELSPREVNEKIIAVYAQINLIKGLIQELSTTELTQLQAGAQEQESVTSNVMTQFLVLGALVVLMVIGASVFITRSIATPLAELAGTANQIAGGNLEAKMPIIKQHDEVGRLASAFATMTDQLRHFIGSLEDRVKARTNELALSMEIGQRALAIRNMDDLLPTTTEFIRERFDLYYVHVYFVDDLGQHLVIKSGTGSVGKKLLARHHTLLVGPGSIVGQVAATGRSIVVSDTENSDIHKSNPLLPDTRSELAVPLMVEGQVIGVLDMQSDRVNTFTKENLAVFEAMAVQLAISIDSAQQWAVAQEAQQRVEATLQRLVGETWAETLAHREEMPAFNYDLSSVTPLNSEIQNGKDYKTVPVMIQNRSIGRLSVQKPETRELTQDEQALMAAVAEQLAQKAENLRLFEQTQQRATREQIARQITDKIRASKDIETALKTTAEALNKALGTAKAVVDLRLSQSSQQVDNEDKLTIIN